jgi:acyl-CoA hydrolase
METRSHHLVLPRDANHYGTLYAGSLLSLALEAGYATAFRIAGPHASLVLKRVLDLRCYDPVAVGHVVEIRGTEVFRARAHLVIALYGSPLPGRRGRWMDGLMQFVQVDSTGRAEPLGVPPHEVEPELEEPWPALRARCRRLLAIRH